VLPIEGLKEVDTVDTVDMLEGEELEKWWVVQRYQSFDVG